MLSKISTSLYVLLFFILILLRGSESDLVSLFIRPQALAEREVVGGGGRGEALICVTAESAYDLT